MTLSRPDLAKLVQLSWLRFPEDLVPCIGPETHDTGEGSLLFAKSCGSHERGKISTELSDYRSVPRTRINGNNKENRCTGQRCSYRLWNGRSEERRVGK